MSKVHDISETEGLSLNNHNESITTPPVVLHTRHFYKARALKTAILLVSMLLLGMVFSLLGSTFVDLMEFFDCDARSITLVMPISSAGLIAASMMAIFRLNRLSVEVSMIISMISLAVITAVWTSVNSIYWFLALSLIHGFFSCLLTCEMQPYFLQLWSNHKLQRPLLLAIYGFLTLGLALGPLAVTPFLTGRSSDPHSQRQEEVLALTDDIENTVTEGVNYSNNSEQLFTSDLKDSIRSEYTGRVDKAFIAIGVPLLGPALLYIIICIKTGTPFWRRKHGKIHHDEESPTKATPKLKKSDRNLLVGITLAFYVFNAIAEFIPLSFFTLFVTVLLDWKPPQSTLINSAFNGFLCVGRLLGIPLSIYLKPRTILLVNLSTVLLAASLLLMSTLHNLIVWIGASLLGLGISLVFGTMLLWLAESLKVTDRIMAAIIISNAVGMMIGPAITGQLFVKVSPMAMTVVIFIASIVTATIYVIQRILERLRVFSDQGRAGIQDEPSRADN